MPVDFFSAGVLVVSWGATYLIHSTCLVAGVWLFVRLNRSAGHALREILWKTALVGGVVTATTQLLLAPRGPFGGLTVTLDSIRPARSAVTAAPLAGLGNLPEFGTADSTTFAFDAASSNTRPDFEITDSARAEYLDLSAEDARSARADTGRVASLPPHQSAFWIAARAATSRLSTGAGWRLAIGTAVAAIFLGVARCFWQSFSLRSKLSRCEVIGGGPGRVLLDELCRMVPRAPAVRLLSAPDDPEPAAFGVRQWTIVLPRRAANDLSNDELKALLAHELAHLVRGDSKWLCVSRVICSLLAFQPLNHLARREWQRAAEFLCDNWAVSRTGTPLALARCLAEVAGWRLSGRASTALLAATGRKSGLAARIERLLESPDDSGMLNEVGQRRGLLCAGALGLALVVWVAPRVDLAVAGNAPQSAIDTAITHEGAGEKGRRTDAAANEGNLVDAASSPADEPTAPHDGTLADNESAAASSTAPRSEGPWAAAVTTPRSADDVLTQLKSLDRELHALESDLRGLEPLLARESAPVQRLARTLRLEMSRLKQRREKVERLVASPTDVFRRE